MEKLAFELPQNSVSFGQIGILILRELFEQEKLNGQKYEISLFPIGGIDLKSQTPNPDFENWIKAKIQYGLENHDRNIPCFKLWHLNGGLSSYSNKQTLLSFYELDSPTPAEINCAKNNNTVFTSQYTCDVFKKVGVETSYLPLAFDSYNFKVVNKKFHFDDRIVFLLPGKVEKRKHTEKVIKSWIKKYGNNPKYSLQCAIFNPFLGRNQEEINHNNNQIIAKMVSGNKPFNCQFYPLMQENVIYNEFLNSTDIIIGMGTESWNMPCHHAVAMGKHAIMLNCNGHKDWATQENSVLVEPSGMEPAADGVFFQQNGQFNTGNIFSFTEDSFIEGCEKAVQRVEKNRVNEAGFTLQKTFSKEKFLDNILKIMK